MIQTQTATIDAILSDVRLFRGLDHKHIARIALTAHPRSYEPGDLIIREGEGGIGLYVISSGEVEVYQTRGGTERHLRTMQEGEVFGELGLLTETPRTATVRAVTRVDCLILTRWNFRAMLEECPRIAVHLTGTLASWLAESGAT